MNYGNVLRKLLADGLGGTNLHLLDASAMPFPGTTTTAAITCFRIGDRPPALRVRAVAAVNDLGELGAGRAVPWVTAQKCPRWSLMI